MTTATHQSERQVGWFRRATRSPVLFIFLLAPVLGELLSSSMPVPEFLVFGLPVAVLYGCGALLVRETAIRWDAGWLGIILLGMAYGIYEEGIVVRSFFDPEWMDLGALGEYGRSGGVNWLWAELLTVFHAAVPIASTLLIADVVFPESRRKPLLGRRGLVWCGVGLAVWTPIGALGLMSASGVLLGGAGFAMLILVLAARAVHQPVVAPRWRPAARPCWFFAAGVVGTAILFLGIYLPAEAFLHSPDGVPAWQATGLAVALGMMLVAGWVMRHSGRFGSWDDRHRVALCWGILAFLSFLTTFAGGPFGPLVALGTMTAMWRLFRKARTHPGGVPVP